MALNSNVTVFRPLAICDHAVAQVRIKWNPGLPELPRPVAEKIDLFWEEDVQKTRRNSFIFNGQLGGINGWRSEGAEFELDLFMTEYKRLYFAKQRYDIDALLIDRYRLSAVLGVSIILISADNHLILIERSGAVGEAPGKFDFIGGHIDPAIHLLDGLPNPFPAIREELVEEIGMQVSLPELRLSGLITTVAPEKPEAFFWFHSTFNAAEILSSGADKNCPEIARLFTVPNDADAVGQFTRLNGQNLSPSAHGGLWLHQKSLTG